MQDDNELTEEELEADAETSDDLPDVEMPPALVAGMTIADWDALPAVKLKWPKSCGVPPEGLDVELVD